MTLANIEAMTNIDGMDNENSSCPNGGYYSTGSRSEDKDRMTEEVWVEGGAKGGKLVVRRFMTMSYNCDNSTSDRCLVCNRYRL